MKRKSSSCTVLSFNNNNNNNMNSTNTNTNANSGDCHPNPPSCSWCITSSFSSSSSSSSNSISSKSRCKPSLSSSRRKQRMNSYLSSLTTTLLFISSTCLQNQVEALTTSTSLRHSAMKPMPTFVPSFLSTAQAPTPASTSTTAATIQSKRQLKPQHVLLYMKDDNDTTSVLPDLLHDGSIPKKRSRSNSSNSNSNSSSEKKNKQRQKTLFQTVAKYNKIQDQLSSLNLDITLSSHSNSRSSSTRNINVSDNNDMANMDVILEQQAQALQISKSTLTYIQLKGQKAREELLLSNMGLVHFTVNKMLYKWNNDKNHNRQSKKKNSSKNKSSSSSSNNNNLNKEDLIQEGMIGLTNAIDKFDLSKNVSFSTYAMYWIEARIIRYAKMKSNFIHIPEYMQSLISKLERKVYEMNVLYNDPSDDSGDEFLMEDGSGSISSTFTKMEELILNDESKMKFLCTELNLDSSTIKKAFQVRRTMYNAKSNSMVELEDYMKMSTSSTSSSITNEYDGIMSTDSLERYQSILTQFISMREMEALSWRYGLREQTTSSSSSSTTTTTTTTAQEETTSSLHNQQRDYEAEAEEDLFGPGGILSSNNSIMSESTTTRTKSTAARHASKPKRQSMITGPSKPSTITSIHTSAFTNQQSTSANSSNLKGSSSGGRWGEAMSFNEVGAQMRVSAEYGRRLCASALKKLTKAAEEGHLDPAMLF